MVEISDSRMKRAAALAAFALISASVVTGAYLFVQKFLTDRQSAMFEPEKPKPTVARRETRTSGPGNAATKNGTRPAGGPPPQTATEVGQAAIQRQLQTLDEINKINEMNRRLMEQQQRMQNRR